MTRIVVLAVAVLAAVAVADVVTSGSRDGAPLRTAAKAAPRETLLEGEDGGFHEDGPYLQARVLKQGEEYLSEEAVADAFPVDVDGPVHISDVAVAPDGTVVVAVYRFPAYGPARAALELWRARHLVAAFAVPAGSFGGGLRFTRDGELIATISRDGARANVFDRRGRLVSTGGVVLRGGVAG